MTTGSSWKTEKNDRKGTAGDTVKECFLLPVQEKSMEQLHRNGDRHFTDGRGAAGQSKEV